MAHGKKYNQAAALVEHGANQPDQRPEDDARSDERGKSSQDPGQQLEFLAAGLVVVVLAEPDPFQVELRILRNFLMLGEEIAKLGVGGQVSLAPHQRRVELEHPAYRRRVALEDPHEGFPGSLGVHLGGRPGRRRPARFDFLGLGERAGNER